MSPATPNIFSCSGYREYLGGVTQKGTKPRLRIKELSKMAGFESAAAMTMILKGRRGLGVESAERLAKHLPLTGRGKDYFIGLVRLENAKTGEEKRGLEEEMLYLRSRRDECVLELPQYRFLSIWYYPVIYSLASGGIPFSAENIAKVIGRGLTARMVKEAVGDLLNLKLLRLENRRLLQTSGGLTTAEAVRHAAIYRYHQAMLDRAKEALELPPDEREMNGLTIRIPKEKLPEVKNRIRQFRKELSEFLMDSTRGEVHQLNVQLFPLTEGASA